jgi:hypothetical protein
MVLQEEQQGEQRKEQGRKRGEFLLVHIFSTATLPTSARKMP